MLGDLLASLSDVHPLFGIFRYVSVRTAAAAATAITLSLGAGRPMIARLQRMQIGETIREDGPAHHQKKAGTPTMGGVLIVASIAISTLLWADLSNALIWVALLTVLACAGIGLADDLRKLRRGRGIAGRTKFVALAGVSLAVGVFLVLYAGTGNFTTRLVVPFLKDFTPDLGWLLVIGAVAVLTASTNAVNLTDGLDGLAAGTVLIAGAAYTVLTYLSGHAVFSEYLYIVHVPGGSGLTVFGAALCGATLGFLWFNAHPAQVFMGDVGALAARRRGRGAGAADPAGAAPDSRRRRLRDRSRFGPPAGGARSGFGAAAFCECRRFTTTSNSADGAKRRSACACGSWECSARSQPW